MGKQRGAFVVITAACDDCPNNRMALNYERTQLCCTSCGAVREPRLDEAKRGHALQLDHPLKYKPRTILEATRAAHRGKVRALPADKRRLDLRIQPGTRDDLNVIIALTGMPVSEIVETAVRRMREGLEAAQPTLPASEEPIDWRFLDDEN